MFLDMLHYKRGKSISSMWAEYSSYVRIFYRTHKPLQNITTQFTFLNILLFLTKISQLNIRKRRKYIWILQIQLMFAAINVHVLANHRISCAINVRILGCQETASSNHTKCSHFDPTAKSANINSVQTLVDLQQLTITNTLLITYTELKRQARPWLPWKD